MHPLLRGARPFAIALLIVAAASLLRVVLFAELGRATAYLTYYPAVVIAAFLGGLPSGLLATLISAILCFQWIQQGWMTGVETLAMGNFILSCLMISGIAEGMRRAQAHARREQEQAETANRAKSAFLARMSHELRTPLNAILGFAEILRGDASLTPEQRRKLGLIHHSGEHLLTLINDVLDMAKIDAERMVHEPTACDLSATIDELVEMLRVRAEQRQLRLVLDRAPEVPRWVRADVLKLRQTLINLIGNALKFTEQGQIVLRLRVRPEPRPGWVRLIVEVEDSGIGIAPADQQRIFEPFVQLGGETRQKGTGLGLSITRKFVEVMGGQIAVQSAPGAGAIFRVELPVALAAAQDAPDPADAARRVTGLAPGQPAWRLLIVDDRLENRELLRELLEPLGFQVRLATNGQECVASCADWQPHLIWMDIRMPVMDGLEATRAIRALPSGQAVIIIAVTASVFREEIDRIKAAGMNDLIRKPYRPDEIHDCLVRYLGVRFQYQETPSVPAAAPLYDSLEEPLANLPPALRDALRQALVQLDQTRINAVIARIAALNPALGDALARTASTFDYSALLQALTPPRPDRLH